MSYKRIEITKKSHPVEWALILLAFPNYRKRTADIVETEKTTLHGRYWDGESISRYAVIGPTKIVNQIPNRSDFPFTAPDIEIDLMDGKQVVQCGVFCGKPGQAYLYRKPSTWVCPRCGYNNKMENDVCMAGEMGDGRCGHDKPVE